MGNKTLIGGAIVFSISLLIFVKLYGGGAHENAATGGSAAIGAVSRNGVPDLTLQKLGGGTVSLAEFRGKKPVVIDFWATWCPNCRRDMPNLNRYYEKYKDKVEVIGVNLQENESTVADFISSRGISFKIALDPSGNASNAFGVQYTNTHILINKDGDFVRAVPGDIVESDIVSLIE